MAAPSDLPPPATPQHGPFALLNDEPVAEPGADLLGAGAAARQLAGLLVASRDATPSPSPSTPAGAWARAA
ncbi:hypothetical protein PQR15_12475 [Streptomyces lydicus]|nr:hypothetical protein [Streptomyces lydicus]